MRFGIVVREIGTGDSWTAATSATGRRRWANTMDGVRGICKAIVDRSTRRIMAGYIDPSPNAGEVIAVARSQNGVPFVYHKPAILEVLEFVPSRFGQELLALAEEEVRFAWGLPS